MYFWTTLLTFYASRGCLSRGVCPIALLRRDITCFMFLVRLINQYLNFNFIYIRQIISLQPDVDVIPHLIAHFKIGELSFYHLLHLLKVKHLPFTVLYISINTKIQTLLSLSDCRRSIHELDCWQSNVSLDKMIKTFEELSRYE